MLEQIRENLEHNLARVESLIQTYETHPDAQGAGRKGTAVLDILRAAAVLLHASLEDVLRGIAHWKLPAASADVLNEIPLAGVGKNAKKFSLGDLAAFRGKTVDQLLRESVDTYLDHSNYNNAGDIAALLSSVGIAPDKLKDHFGALQPLMLRRHQIVHRADRQTQVTGSGDHQVRAINKHTVREWAAAVSAFSNALFGELAALPQQK